MKTGKKSSARPTPPTNKGLVSSAKQIPKNSCWRKRHLRHLPLQIKKGHLQVELYIFKRYNQKEETKKILLNVKQFTAEHSL